MTSEEIAIMALQNTNAELVSAVNTTKANIEQSVADGVTQAGDTVVSGMFSVVSNSIETKTLFLKFINK
jgi:hypothetical protein